MNSASRIGEEVRSCLTGCFLEELALLALGSMPIFGRGEVAPTEHKAELPRHAIVGGLRGLGRLSKSASGRAQRVSKLDIGRAEL